MSRPLPSARRRDIVNALREILLEGKTTLPSNDTIAKSAGMSRQLVRHYYGDQKQIARDLAEDLADGYRARLSAIIRNGKGRSRLELFLDFYFGVLDDADLAKPRDDRVYDAIFHYAAGDEILRAAIREQYDQVAQLFAQELIIEHPALTPPVASELAHLLTSMMYGHWKMVESLGGSRARHRHVREAADRLIESYVADPPIREVVDGPVRTEPRRPRA